MQQNGSHDSWGWGGGGVEAGEGSELPKPTPTGWMSREAAFVSHSRRAALGGLAEAEPACGSGSSAKRRAGSWPVCMQASVAVQICDPKENTPCRFP